MSSEAEVATTSTSGSPGGPGYRVATDTGGTFTDFIVLDEASGAYRIVKVPSTPDDPGRAIRDGLKLLAEQGVPPGEIRMFFHGTTVATNALLEERGARVGLAITAGFRGVYETMEQSRPFGPSIFNLGYQKPALLVPQSRTAEISERTLAHGEVRMAPDEASVKDALALFEGEGVESVAICLLFSFASGANEAQAARALRLAHPEWHVTASSELLPQMREYYRLSTTVINAYVSPVLARYVAALARDLDRQAVAPGRRFTMQSNGGAAPFETTAERGVATILSGPAGGVTAGVALGEATGIGNIITFDMGGTSCDVALVQDGEPIISDQSKVDGRHIAVPMLEINTVSAGGGTLASVDEHGALRVGPRSAGAVPGPACYARGGVEATVTDANMVLGYLNPAFLLDGDLVVSADAATRAVQDNVATPLGVDVHRAADGIVRVVNVKMAQAIRSISTERGFDLRDFTLVPFGGAGPLHACQIALDLGIPRVLVPAIPGATSALGLLLSDVKHDFVRSRLADIAALPAAQVNEIFEDLAASGRRQLLDEGFADAQIRFRYFIDMRYAGQGYENPVPVAALPVSEEDLPRYRADFDEIHRACHGHAAPGQPVEVVNYRVQCIGTVPRVSLRTLAASTGPAQPATFRQAYFPAVAPGPVATPVYRRDELRAGHTFDGPAIVEQYDSTVVILPQQCVSVDGYGNLIVTRREEA